MEMNGDSVSTYIAAGVSLFLGLAVAAQAADNVWDQVNETGIVRCSALADYPPASWKVDTEAKYEGYVINFCRAIAKDLSVDLKKEIVPEFVETTWATVILDIQAGRIDLASGLSPNAERLQAVDMPGPAYTLSDVIVYTKAANSELKTWEDFNSPSISIATISGAMPERTAMEMAPNASFLSFKSRPEVILAIQSGRASYHATTFLGALGALKEAPELFAGIISPRPVRANPSHLGARKDGDGRFTQWVQAWTEKALADGTSMELMKDALGKAGLDAGQLDKISD